MNVSLPTLEITVQKVVPQPTGGNHVTCHFQCKKCGRERISVPQDHDEIRTVYCLGCFTVHGHYDDLLRAYRLVSQRATEARGA